MDSKTTHTLSQPWHYLGSQGVLHVLQSSGDIGLSLDEVEKRRALWGENIILQKKSKSAFLRLLSQFHQPLIYILNASALIAASMGDWVDAGVIFGVVLLNATIGFVQEGKAHSAIEALSRAVDTSASVLREGIKAAVSSKELVVGDIVLLKTGDKLPADLRLLKTSELSVDESMLTGESLPVSKHAARVELNTLIGDRTNMAYTGSLVITGQATGVVTAIGMDTQTGHISALMESADDLVTPLTKKIEWFSRILLYAILGLGLFTFAVGLARDENAYEMFMAVIALCVGAIPEGLPAAVTVTLAIGVANMAKRNAIIRKLPAVETLGCTTVICSDKTGTLTQNRMSVQKITAGYESFDIDDITATLDKGSNIALRECLTAAVLCSDASIEKKNGKEIVHGTPTETALIRAAQHAGLDIAALRSSHGRLAELPFESRHQYMATLHEGVVYIKGAAEKLLAKSVAAIDREGRLVPLDIDAIEQSVQEMAQEGMRVLAFAKKEVEGNTEKISHALLGEGLVFVGLQAMIDPPRVEAATAVAACRRAGIEVKMITGDHASTAMAVARKISIADGSDRAVRGDELAEMDEEALRECAKNSKVFARVQPEQKLRLVKALQSGGHVVAMTGDGVNDAPALKQADIGVAMGLIGTEVAKQAADMVLVDDNFASIEAAVEEGRGVYDNITKFIVWTLPTNFGEGLVITVAVLFGTALPILPVQILWINMTTAVFMGLMLAFEPIENGAMDRAPRKPSTSILTPPLLFRIVAVSALLLLGSFGLFMAELERGKSVEYARTVAANVFVMGELFYLFNCRSMSRSMFSLGLFSNRWLVGGVAVMIVLQLAFTYAPIMNLWFHTVAVDADSWIRILCVGVVVYSLVGLEKWIVNRFAKEKSKSLGGVREAYRQSALNP